MNIVSIKVFFKAGDLNGLPGCYGYVLLFWHKSELLSSDCNGKRCRGTRESSNVGSNHVD